MAQMTRLIEQSNRRNENALYLTGLLSEIPGIKPAKLYDGATRSAYHLYMFRYDKAQFAGLDRARFLAALSAEGVPCSAGYGVMNKDDYVSGLAKNKHFLKLYGEKRLAGVARPQPEPVGERQALRASGVVHPEHAPGGAEQDGPDRRGHPQDPEHAVELARA